VDEPGELVAGEERLLEGSVPRHGEVLCVGEDRFDQLLGIALVTQKRSTVLRVLVEGRVHLVVEVVEERGDAPELLVLVEAPGVPADGGLDGEGVAPERLALRVLREGFPGLLAGHFHRAD
jgi:hypothetical protein